MSIEPNKPETKFPPINMLLAFALTGLVIFGTPYIYKLVGVKMPERTEQATPAKNSSLPQNAGPQNTGDAQIQSSAPSPAAPTQAGATPSQAPSAGAVTGSAEESTTIETDLYHIVFSNRGAVIKSWTLKKFPDHAGQPLDVVNDFPAAVQKVGYPFHYELRDAKPVTGSSVPSLTLNALSRPLIAPGAPTTTITIYGAGFANPSVVYFNNTALQTTFVKPEQLTAVIPDTLLAKPMTAAITVNASGATSNSLNLTVDMNQVLFKATKSDDGLSIDFDYQNGGIAAKKKFSFERNSYLVQIESSATVGGTPLPYLLAWRGGFGDLAVPNAASKDSAVFYDTVKDKVEREKAKAAKNGPTGKDGTFGWAGLEDQYFAAIFLSTGSPLQPVIFSDQVSTVSNGSDEAFVGMGIASDAKLFLGPKDPETLRKVTPKLESIVDFGYFWFIAKPLFQSLHWMNNNWFHNYGWSIIGATFIINLFLFPLKLANLKSMRKMQSLQPEIAKINEKYKSLPLRDPKQADKNAEMMALYSKAGTNPLSGCIPMLVQMPFLWAFYTVLSVSLALRGASWLWVHDLSQPEQLGIRILPILLVITGFVMQKMTPMAAVDPAQQKTMMLMPLMMGFIFYQASSGLVLYWLTSNFVGIAQQWLLNKAMPKPDTPAVVVKDVKKSNNRK